MPRWTSSPRKPVEVEPKEAFDRITALVQERLPDVVENAVQQHGELTLHVDRTRLLDVLRLLRDHHDLRFELLSSVSGVDYLNHPGHAGDDRRLHAVYHLTSLTYRRRVRVEVAVTVDDPHVPSAVPVYPTADWHERETWDFFGIVFDGHPNLTRIEMPDDWEGHPQRKDYPLGGVPVEYKGAQIPPPEDRRAWA
ncbi:MAG TPA: NADH-quinone oxidoreductase subunit C [Mycobacteriales bacterium]|jgi:NADH-quinone oxidoreductase subunit C